MTSFRRNLRRATTRFLNASVGEILRNYTRAVRHYLGLPGNRQHAAPHGGIRIVVSLSTTPARARRIRPTLRSLLDQDILVDRICLAYPDFSTRENRNYPDPQTLNLPANVDVLPCKDFGPATKFIPALTAEPDALLIIVDDDVIYPRDFVATLVRAHQGQPDSVFAYRGVNNDQGIAFGELDHVMATGIAAPQSVDIIFGTWGYALPAGVIDAYNLSFDGLPDQLKWVDDVWLSGLLANAGVPRRVTVATNFPIEVPLAWRYPLSGTLNRDGSNDQAAIQTFTDGWNQKR